MARAVTYAQSTLFSVVQLRNCAFYVLRSARTLCVRKTVMDWTVCGAVHKYKGPHNNKRAVDIDMDMEAPSEGLKKD